MRSRERADGGAMGGATTSLRGRMVTLRPVTADDHALLLTWQNDAEIARWMDYRTPLRPADLADEQERAAREGLPFIIEVDGRPVGKCGLNQFRAEIRTCSLYIYVGDKTVWSRGVGTDAVMTLLALAFDGRRMARVELVMLADNDRAGRVYEACGFRREGTLRGRSWRRGEWQDTTVMSVQAPRFSVIRKTYGI